MSAARHLSRAARASTRVSLVTTFTKPAVRSFARSISCTTKSPNADPLVVASEIPHSIFSDGKVQTKTIVVRESAEQETLIEEVKDTVTPLTRAVYNQMPCHMQKMTLMDKVIVVTGYVLTTLLVLTFK